MSVLVRWLQLRLLLFFRWCRQSTPIPSDHSTSNINLSQLIMFSLVHRPLRTNNLHTTILFSYVHSKTVNTPTPRGKLMIVPTSIGNLSDLSPNIIKALFTADLIGCEDRRIAGQLYHLIRGRKIIDEMEERFGSLGLTGLIQIDQQEAQQEEKAHQFYNYANMSDTERRKFLRKMTQKQQTSFRVQFLKYRAKKVLSKDSEWLYPNQSNRFDQLYGIDLSDMKHIETQILNCRKKKGRGVLIPLNTYNQTKMFDMVKALLESKKVALVSDAGMPCISDPGWKLVDKIRNSMPDVPIEVIGGPSSVSILTLQASVCAKGQALSGRFEGFSSLATGYFEQKHRDVQKLKMNQFSIHFINANKLKGRLLELERKYGGHHKIIVNNELTKKYQRRFQGTITQLIDKIDHPDFKPVGQISFLLYPAGADTVQENQLSLPAEHKSEQQSLKQEPQITLGQTVKVTIPNFLTLIDKYNPKMRPKDRVKLLCEVFGIKTVTAREFVYDKFTSFD